MHLFSSKSLHKIALLGAGTAITAIIGRSGGNARSMVLSVAALTTAAVILFGGDVYGVGKRKRGEEEETVDPENWIHQHVFTAEQILLFELNMPKFNVLAGLLDGTLDDTDRDGFSNNQANPLDTSQLQSHKDLVKLENLALDVDEVDEDEDEDEVDEDEDEDEVDAVRFMF